MTHITYAEVIQTILAGGLLGVLGQAIRVIAGIKKLHDTAVAGNRTIAELFNPGLLVVSLLIGFTVGALALLTIELSAGGSHHEDIVTAGLAAGYAGTDFIEAFMKKGLSACVPVHVRSPPAVARITTNGNGGKGPDQEGTPVRKGAATVPAGQATAPDRP